jgi:hypothetical protein
MFKSMVGAEFVAVVPHDVRRVVGARPSVGSPVQDGIAWIRQRWINQFTQFAPALTLLPDRLDRSVVLGACRRAAARAVEAEQAFLAGGTRLARAIRSRLPISRPAVRLPAGYVRHTHRTSRSRTIPRLRPQAPARSSTMSDDRDRGRTRPMMRPTGCGDGSTWPTVPVRSRTSYGPLHVRSRRCVRQCLQFRPAAAPIVTPAWWGGAQMKVMGQRILEQIAQRFRAAIAGATEAGG